MYLLKYHEWVTDSTSLQLSGCGLLGNMGILTPVKPSNRERENAYCCITDGWNWNCRTECMCNHVSRRYDYIFICLKKIYCVVSLITNYFRKFKPICLFKPLRKRELSQFPKNNLWLKPRRRKNAIVFWLNHHQLSYYACAIIPNYSFLTTYAHILVCNLHQGNLLTNYLAHQ